MAELVESEYRRLGIQEIVLVDILDVPALFGVDLVDQVAH